VPRIALQRLSLVTSNSSALPRWCAHWCDGRHARSRRAGGTFERGDIAIYAPQDSVSERATLGVWGSCSFWWLQA
jgi:hypothetical protein